MSYLRDFAHSFQNIGHVRPEQKAIPTLSIKPMIRELARRESGERIGEMQRSNIRYRSLASLADYKRDIRAARHDAPIATVIEGANLALSIPMARETKRQAEIQKKASEEQLEILRRLKVAVEMYPLEIMKMWKTPQTPTEPEPLRSYEEEGGLY